MSITHEVVQERTVISTGQLVAAFSIVTLGAINYAGVREGNLVQSLFTVVKVVAIAAIPVLALILHPVTPALGPAAAHIPHPAASFALAMIAVSWAYAGWNYVCFASGEIRDPARTLPRAIVVGLPSMMRTTSKWTPVD